MNPHLVSTQQNERDGERCEVVDGAVCDECAEQAILGHRRHQEQQHELEHADAPGDIAGGARGQCDQVDRRKCAETDRCFPRQQHEQDAGRAQHVDAADADLRKGHARRGHRNHEAAKLERPVARADQPQIGADRGQEPAAGEHRQPVRHMQHGCGHSGIRQQRQAEQQARAQKEGQRAEGDDGADLYGAQAKRGIGAIAHRSAADRIQADVVADGIAHERDQGNARIGHAGPGKAHGQGIVQGQAAVPGEAEECGAQQLGVRDGVHAIQDVAPVILAQQVMQHEQRHPQESHA